MRWLIALVLIAAGVFAGRALAVREIERGMIKTRRQSQKTPRAAFEALPIVLPDRTLNAFYVPADGPGYCPGHLFGRFTPAPGSSCTRGARRQLGASRLS